MNNLQTKSLIFNGLSVNATMLRTMISLHTAFKKEHRVLLQQIDCEYGREMLSMSYNKLRLLLQQCKNDP